MYIADGEPAKWSNQQDLKISIYGSKDRKKKVQQKAHLIMRINDISDHL